MSYYKTPNKQKQQTSTQVAKGQHYPWKSRSNEVKEVISLSNTGKKGTFIRNNAKCFKDRDAKEPPSGGQIDHFLQKLAKEKGVKEAGLLNNPTSAQEDDPNGKYMK
jgi:hypothetical protein